MSKRTLLRFILASYLSILLLILLHHYTLVDISAQVLTDLARKAEVYADDRNRMLRQLEELSPDERGPPKDFSSPLKLLLRPAQVNCSNAQVVVILKSRPEEFYLRLAIRETWGRQFRGRLVFILGRGARHPDPSESAIYVESKMYGDLVLADFIDSYHNLSLKSLTALKWISGECHDVQFILQGDTDAMIFPQHVLKFVDEHLGEQQKIYGYCWKGARVRRAGKWRVDVRDYVPLTYPTYCSGATIIMTSDVPSRLLASLDPKHSYFPIDDAFFTGILAEAAFIQRVNIPSIYWGDDLDLSSTEKCNCVKPIAVMEYKSSALLRNAWKTFGEYLAKCRK